MDLEGFGEGSGRALDVKIEVFLAFSAHIAQDNIARNRYIIIHLFWLPFLMTSESFVQRFPVPPWRYRFRKAL